jgi:hypothetical protein
MCRSHLTFGRETAMPDPRVEPQSPSGTARADDVESSAARQPFVPPTVMDLGGLTRLTQLGGTV